MSGVLLFTYPSLFLPSTRLRFRLHLPIPLLMVTETKAQAKAQALLTNAAANANAHAGTKISPAVVPEKIGADAAAAFMIWMHAEPTWLKN